MKIRCLIFDHKYPAEGVAEQKIRYLPSEGFIVEVYETFYCNHCHHAHRVLYGWYKATDEVVVHISNYTNL